MCSGVGLRQAEEAVGQSGIDSQVQKRKKKQKCVRKIVGVVKMDG